MKAPICAANEQSLINNSPACTCADLCRSACIMHHLWYICMCVYTKLQNTLTQIGLLVLVKPNVCVIYWLSLNLSVRKLLTTHVLLKQAELLQSYFYITDTTKTECATPAWENKSILLHTCKDLSSKPTWIWSLMQYFLKHLD